MDQLSDAERQVLRRLGVDPDDVPAQPVEFRARQLPSASEVAALLDAKPAQVEPIVRSLQAGSASRRTTERWLKRQRGRTDWRALADEAAVLGMPP